MIPCVPSKQGLLWKVASNNWQKHRCLWAIWCSVLLAKHSNMFPLEPMTSKCGGLTRFTVIDMDTFYRASLESTQSVLMLLWAHMFFLLSKFFDASVLCQAEVRFGSFQWTRSIASELMALPKREKNREHQSPGTSKSGEGLEGTRKQDEEGGWLRVSTVPWIDREHSVKRFIPAVLDWGTWTSHMKSLEKGTQGWRTSKHWVLEAGLNLLYLGNRKICMEYQILLLWSL